MDFSKYKEFKWFRLTINTSYTFNIEKFLLFTENLMCSYGITLKKIILSKMYMTPHAIKSDSLLKYANGVKSFIDDRVESNIEYNEVICIGKIGRTEFQMSFSPIYNDYNILCSYGLCFMDTYCCLDSSFDKEIIKKLEEFVGEEFIIESYMPTHYM